LPWAAIGITKDYEFYNLKAAKNDANLFTKWQYQLNNKWSTFMDVQLRHVEHVMNGFRDNPTLFVNKNLHFSILN
jgi:iron complex outermembrane receptor protein